MTTEAETTGRGRRTLLIVLSIGGLAAAAGLLASQLGDSPGPPTTMDFVCVTTGEVVRLHVDEAAMIPALNRSRGTRTMLPCVREVDGRYRVPERYRPLLTDRLGTANRCINAEGYLTAPHD